MISARFFNFVRCQVRRANLIEDDGEHIDSHQFGSLKGTSTTYCLLDLIHNWLCELDNPGCYLRACFLDFSKASDRIDHTIVIRELIVLGVRRSIIPWICSFLNRSVAMCQTRTDRLQLAPSMCRCPSRDQTGSYILCNNG